MAQAVLRAANEAQAAVLRGTVQNAPQSAYKLDHPWTYQPQQSPIRKPGQILDTRYLRRVADTIDPLRSAIEQVKREVRDARLSVVPRDEKDRKSGTPATLAKTKEAEAFFARKGGNGGFGKSRNSFEGEIVEDLLVIGAWAVYRERFLGGEFQQYAIDAATIMPRVDDKGWDAIKPFAQWIDGREVRQFAPEEMVYDGVNGRSYTPYFVSPIEWLLSPLTSYAKVDEWNRCFLTDGNAPGDDVFTFGAEITTDQARAWMALFDENNAGNTRERRKIKVLPNGSQRLSIGTRKEQDFQEFETQLIRRICSIYGVQPASIGYAGEQYKVSQEGSHDQTSKFGVGAVLEKRKELYDDTLEALGYEDLETVVVSDEEEDSLQRAQRLVLAVGGKPWKTVNEARAEDGLDPIQGGDELVQDDPADPKADPKEKPADAAKRAWMGICLKRLSRGLSPAYPFRHEAIDQEAAKAILARLEAASDDASVRSAFD